MPDSSYQNPKHLSIIVLCKSSDGEFPEENSLQVFLEAGAQGTKLSKPSLVSHDGETKASYTGDSDREWRSTRHLWT